MQKCGKVPVIYEVRFYQFIKCIRNRDFTPSPIHPFLFGIALLISLSNIYELSKELIWNFRLKQVMLQRFPRRLVEIGINPLGNLTYGRFNSQIVSLAFATIWKLVAKQCVPFPPF